MQRAGKKANKCLKEIMAADNLNQFCISGLDGQFLAGSWWTHGLHCLVEVLSKQTFAQISFWFSACLTMTLGSCQRQRHRRQGLTWCYHSSILTIHNILLIIIIIVLTTITMFSKLLADERTSPSQMRFQWSERHQRPLKGLLVSNCNLSNLGVISFFLRNLGE